MAADNFNKTVLKSLLSSVKPKDLNQRNHLGETPLMIFLLKNNIFVQPELFDEEVEDILNLFEQLKGDFKAKDSCGKTIKERCLMNCP